MSKTPKEQLLLAQQYVATANTLSKQRQYEAAFPILEKANALTLPEGEASDIVRADIWYAMSNCYSAKHDFTTALSLNQQAFDIRMKIFGITVEATLEAAITMGWIWNMQGKFRKALDYYHTILNQCQLTPPDNSLNYGRLFFYIGEEYKALEDYWQAILHFQKATEIFQALNTKDKHSQAITYKGIGVCYAQVTNLKEATHYFQKALDEYHNHPFPQDIADLYVDMGLMYYRAREVQKAIECYQKSIKVLDELGSTLDHTLGIIRLRSTIYSSLGRAHGSLKNFEQASQYLQKALKDYIQVYGNKHPRVAHTYYLLGHIYNMQKSYWKSIQYLQEGLVAFIPTFNEKEVYRNPSLQDLQNLENNVGIILLATKARVFRSYYLEVETEDRNIDIALKSAELAIGVMEQMRQGYFSDHSKLSIEQGHSRAYQIGLDVAHTAWKKLEGQQGIEKAFLFAEKSKAVLLLSAMQSEIAKVKSPIPSELLQQEQDLKKQLIQLDKDIQTQKTTQKDADVKDKAIQNLHVEFLDYHRQYSELMQQLEKIYPDYYQIKYQSLTISIPKIQALLQDQELLVQYCLFGQQLFILTVDKTNAAIESVPLSKDFLQWIPNFQKSIFLSDLEEYISISLQLYSVLFLPIESQLEGKGKLIIIPDGALHSLPFDALISPIADESSIENFSQLPYLLQRFQVRYHYSATLIGQSHFKKQMELRSKIQDGFLGVAPVKFGKKVSESNGYILKSQGGERKITLKSEANEAEALVDLEATETEVKKVYELFEKQQKEAIALFYDMASKEQLLEYIEGYKHILLSTHGFTDKENASLSGLNLYVEEQGEMTDFPSSLRDFGAGWNKPSNGENENGKLYISDVMNLQLKAELVVLSSCESGVGKLQQGEGMMALHRAFLYAGAQNIVYSLFKVPQDSTSELIQTFFRYALEGNGYPDALRKAKLELVKNESMEPIDWAGFALIGG